MVYHAYNVVHHTRTLHTEHYTPPHLKVAMSNDTTVLHSWSVLGADGRGAGLPGQGQQQRDDSMSTATLGFGDASFGTSGGGVVDGGGGSPVAEGSLGGGRGAYNEVTARFMSITHFCPKFIFKTYRDFVFFKTNSRFCST